MHGRRLAQRDFEEFVAALSPGLLRTAYLLTGDRDLAEDLLQSALAKAWSAWNRPDDPPESHVRRILVTAYATWWRRRRHGEPPVPVSGHGTDQAGLESRQHLWAALGRLPPRQRAVVVLRFFDDLSETDAADLLGCSVGTVRSRTSTALARLPLDPDPGDGGNGAPHVRGAGRRVDALRRSLREESADVQELSVPERLTGVYERVGRRRRRRRTAVAVAAAVTSVAAVAGAAAVRPYLPGSDLRRVAPTPERMVQPPPTVFGHRLPLNLTVDGLPYEYQRSEVSPPGRELLRVAVPSARTSQVVAWATPPATRGEVVVSVDGELVSRGDAGVLQSDHVLSGRRPHLVVIRVTRPEPDTQIAFALYGWPYPDRGTSAGGTSDVDATR